MREFPQELIDKAIDQLAEIGRDDNLRTCSLVVKCWTSQAQKKYFESVHSPMLDTSKRLLTLISASPHTGADVKFLQLQLDFLDVGTYTASPSPELVTLPVVIEHLLHLEGLDLSVITHCGLLGSGPGFWRGTTVPATIGAFVFVPTSINFMPAGYV
ncbi:hypothetical protein K438DRAFT_1837331 [Mycena galopus ATCC 62051]|nr:hypothetical protein K438DRAFT_1837331 [Mycena galopus ATCC 62051]